MQKSASDKPLLLGPYAYLSPTTDAPDHPWREVSLTGDGLEYAYAHLIGCPQGENQAEFVLEHGFHTHCFIFNFIMIPERTI